MSKGNFKVRCISNNGNNYSSYTVGKVYEIKDGMLTTDSGNKIPSGGDETFADWCSFSSSKWELVQDNQSIIIYRKDREVIANIKEGKKVIKSAKTTCNPSDEFVFEVGAKLALARLFNPSVKYLEVETVRIVREVNRPAKIGEWVKVVNASGHSVEVGTIGQVTSTWNYGVYINSDVRYSRGLLFESNYVVLENYQPEDKPKTLVDYSIKELVTELLRRAE